jgi:titin
MWVEKARPLAYWLLTLLVVASLGAIAAKPAYATTFTVNSTGNGNDLDFPGGTFDGSSDGTCDSNFTVTITCTLRAAIQEANASSTTNDTIDFNILAGAPGCNASGVCTISPTSRLPNITDTVIIDGYTQSGADDNAAITNANNAVLKIELSGANAGGTADGLTVAGTGAGGTTIKGLVINRFGEDGVVIFNGANAVIEGNFIGTNAAGDAALGNGIGVRVVTSGNRIGGPANAAQNIISGNDTTGVLVAGSSATGNTISNNHIGTDADAGEDLGNAQNGVFISGAPDVVVGGNGANGAGKDVGGAQGEGNIISGNDQHGVSIDNLGASGTKVQGNFIGLNLNGNGFSNIGNSRDGVRVSSAPQVEIGGTGSTFSNGQGNTISDNGQHGVEISGSSSTGTRVLGNHIGTDFNGGSDFGNAGDGVRVGNASNTTIGGTSAGARNVISGNDANGVFIQGTNSATFNKVEGNYVGLDASGTGALGNNLGNAEVGVRVETPGNFIGGTASGARNVISDNGGTGVSILATGVSNAKNNKVEGNLIGTDADGEGALGNFHGVSISGAPGNVIGGTDSAATNTISGNDNHGVMVLGAAATGNSVLRNSIFGNGTPGGLGIALNNDGVTANDNKDPDGGPNLLQNFPVITSASTTTITGNLNSRPRKTFTIQFFSNPVPNFPTLFGEGETFLGEKTVRTNDRGKVSFTFATTLDTDEFVTATATDAAGNTSEFSQARTVE